MKTLLHISIFITKTSSSVFISGSAEYRTFDSPDFFKFWQIEETISCGYELYTRYWSL